MFLKISSWMTANLIIIIIIIIIRIIYLLKTKNKYNIKCNTM